MLFQGKKDKGNLGEKIAVNLLKNKGYEIIGQNYFSRYGEIDIICREKNQLVFVEVKTRIKSDYGIPEEAFTSKKQERFLKTIYEYLEKNGLKKADWRCDLASIEIDRNGKVLRQEILENVELSANL